jgi:hypothetical protein
MRKANLIQTSIWLDRDFLALGVDAKLLYLLLLTQPDVTHVGIVTLAPARWTRQLGMTQRRFQTALRELVDTRFVVYDQETDEVLIRSWVKHNLAGSKLEQAGKTHFPLVGSSLLRWVLQSEHPWLFGDPPVDTPPNTLLPTPPLTHGEGDQGKGRGSSSSVDRTRARETVWAAYQDRHPQSVLSSERRNLLDRRLDDYPAETLVAAIAGNHLDPHCNGENPSGKQYHDFELILRDADHIERYAGIATHGIPERPPEGIVEWALSEAAKSDRDAPRELGDGS